MKTLIIIVMLCLATICSAKDEWTDIQEGDKSFQWNSSTAQFTKNGVRMDTKLKFDKDTQQYIKTNYGKTVDIGIASWIVNCEQKFVLSGQAKYYNKGKFVFDEYKDYIASLKNDETAREVYDTGCKFYESMKTAKELQKQYGLK